MTSSTTNLAKAVRRASKKAVAASPHARGADWRTQTVASVGTDGTITTSDGVRARRLNTYQAPAPGDWIVITRSGAGSWLALGRLSSGTASNGAWTALPMASGFTTQHTGLGAAQYRLITSSGTPRVELQGSVDCTTAITTETAFTTALPSAAWPSVVRSWVGRRNYSSSTLGVVPMEISAAGVMSVFGSASPETTTWFALDGCFYDL